MSLYIGSDNNGNKIVHITKGIVSQDSMKKGVSSNTVFHSSLNYMFLTQYSGTISDNILTVDLYTKSQLLNKRFIIVDCQNNVILSDTLSIETNSGTVHYGIWSNNTMKFYNPVLDGDCTIYRLNLDKSEIGYLSDNTIQIAEGSMIISGVNLMDFLFVSPIKINNTDVSFLSGANTFQIVNYFASDTDSVELISNPSGTHILRSGNVIFSSEYSVNLEFMESSSLTFSTFTSQLKKSISVTKSYTLTKSYNINSYAVASIATLDGYSSVFIPNNGEEILVYSKNINTVKNDVVATVTVEEPVYGWTTFTDYTDVYRCHTEYKYVWNDTTNEEEYVPTEVCAWEQEPFQNTKWEIQYYLPTPHEVGGQVFTNQKYKVHAYFKNGKIYVRQSVNDSSYIEANFYADGNSPDDYPDYVYGVIDHDGFTISFDIFGI